MVANLLGLSHSYLREDIFGTVKMAVAKIDVEQRDDQVAVRRSMPNVIPPLVFDLNYRRDGRRADIWADARWNKPGCFLIDTGSVKPGQDRAEGSGVVGTHFLTPINDQHCHYFLAAIRSN